MALPISGTGNSVKRKADPNRKPIPPRSFFFIYKGSLEGEPTVTFDKMEAMDRLLEANAAGDTTLKMKKMTLPKTSRQKASAASTV